MYVCNLDNMDQSHTRGEHMMANRGRKRKATDEGFSGYFPYRDIVKDYQAEMYHAYHDHNMVKCN